MTETKDAEQVIAEALKQKTPQTITEEGNKKKNKKKKWTKFIFTLFPYSILAIFGTLLHSSKEIFSVWKFVVALWVWKIVFGALLIVGAIELLVNNF